MINNPFEPARLRLGRELKGWSQAELAKRLNVTAAALSQFESGASRPSDATEERLGNALGVPRDFFRLPLVETHEGFFRSLRRTAVVDRRRARAIAHVAHDLATITSAAEHLPAPTVPGLAAPPLDATPAAVEAVAAEARTVWRVGRGPVPNIVALLESHGILVIRLPLDSADVDAFSLPFADRAVVVLGSDKNDRARSRFDAAHELGHLVMHGEAVWGLPEVEKQAHGFAAAFLMPAKDIYDELPARMDWPTLFELKRKWQVSLAALLMRAKTLEKMSETEYVKAIKAASARGWRRQEPVPLGKPEQPSAIRELLTVNDSFGNRGYLPEHVLAALADAVAA